MTDEGALVSETFGPADPAERFAELSRHVAEHGLPVGHAFVEYLDLMGFTLDHPEINRRFTVLDEDRILAMPRGTRVVSATEHSLNGRAAFGYWFGVKRLTENAWATISELSAAGAPLTEEHRRRLTAMLHRAIAEHYVVTWEDRSEAVFGLTWILEHGPPEFAGESHTLLGVVAHREKSVDLALEHLRSSLERPEDSFDPWSRVSARLLELFEERHVLYATLAPLRQAYEARVAERARRWCEIQGQSTRDTPTVSWTHTR